MGWKFRIEQTLHDRLMSVGGWKDNGDGTLTVLKPVQIEKIAEGDYLSPEQYFINHPWDEAKQMLQALVDTCFEAGIRPSGIEDFRRANDSQKAHLEDMRAIVSKTVGVVLPGADG